MYGPPSENLVLFHLIDLVKRGNHKPNNCNTHTHTHKKKTLHLFAGTRTNIRVMPKGVTGAPWPSCRTSAPRASASASARRCGRSSGAPLGSIPSFGRVGRSGADRTLLPRFARGGGGSPTKIDYRKRGTLILTSLLEDLGI